MDLNDYWQENKRFLLTVAGGVLVFLIGEMIVGSVFGDELTAQRRSMAASSRKLRSESMFQRQDLTAARQENEALKAAASALSEAVAFQTRPRFRFVPERGSPSSQFFGTVSAVREELLTLAGRNELELPDAVGLPSLSPTRDGDIERHLEALDLIDRVVRACVEAGVDRIDRIEIKLDPALNSRQGVGPIERTHVEFTLSGKTAPIQRLLLATQAGRDAPLLVEKLEMIPSKREEDEGRLEVTFMIARLTGLAAALGEGEDA